MFDGMLGLAAGGLSYLGAHQANKANKQMAREQMAFQERMSNTAYQRSVADMRAAGINPMLSAKLGGASTPSGSSAQMSDEIGPATNSAVAARRASAELANMRESNKLIQAQVLATQADAELKIATAKQVGLGYAGNILGSKLLEAAGSAASRYFSSPAFSAKSVSSMTHSPTGGPGSSSGFKIGSSWFSPTAGYSGRVAPRRLK